MQLSKLYITLLFIGLISHNGYSQRLGNVYTVGAMNEMGKTNYEIKVWLDTNPDKPHLFGLAPYDRMKGK